VQRLGGAAEPRKKLMKSANDIEGISSPRRHFSLAIEKSE
jgi:hypothetical protein